MGTTVAEIMTRDVVAIAPNESTREVVDSMLEHGVTVAPVLDAERRPIGVASLPDLVANDDDPPQSTRRASRPPTCVRDTISVEEAGLVLAHSGYQHIVVIGEDGRAVGMVSALDVLRTMLGMPVRPTEMLPRASLPDVTWSPVEPLNQARVDRLPSRPGVMAILRSSVASREALVHVEATDSLFDLGCDLLESKGQFGGHRSLYFRYAQVSSVGERTRLVDEMTDWLEDMVH